MAKERGLKHMWNGTPASLLLVSNPIIQFFCYEQLKLLILGHRAAVTAQKKQGASAFAVASSVLPPLEAFVVGALAKAARPMMQDQNGAIVAMSYLGAVRSVPNYNVMGLAKASLEANVRYLAASLGPEGTRVNAISAGPIHTLAASGIKDFRKMLAANEAATPLRKNVTIENVGNTAAFLCSDLAGGITGDTIYVDAGFHAVAGSVPA